VSTPIDDGGQAFPSADSQHPNGDVEYGKPGMTLRDWFAGQALIAIPHIGCGSDLNALEIAKDAYVFADAMLKARGGAS
jgi:hypothetical protein